MNDLGERIKQRRTELELTQEELARDAGVSKGFLSDIENGHRGVGAGKLNGIARALGVTIDYLMSGKGRMQTNAQIQVPAGLANLARDRNLSFSAVQTLLDMKQQIVAHRSLKRSSSDEFDWKKLYESVKGFIEDE